MPIKVPCPCGKVTNVPDAYAGRVGKCPACGKPVRVPTKPGETAPAVSQNLSVSAVADTMPGQATPAGPEPVRPAAETMPLAEATAIHANEPAEENWQSPPLAKLCHDDDLDLDKLAPKSTEATESIHTPTQIPHELEQPDCPVLQLLITTDAAYVFTGFDASLVLDTLLESLARHLHGKFDLRIVERKLDEGAAGIHLHLVRMHQGYAKWRYLFPVIGNFFGAATCLIVDGHIQLPEQARMPYKLSHGCTIGLLRGPLGLLKVDARALASKLAMKVGAGKGK